MCIGVSGFVFLCKQVRMCMIAFPQVRTIYMFICLCHLHMYTSMRCICSYGSYVIPGGLVNYWAWCIKERALKLAERKLCKKLAILPEIYS